MSCMKCCVSTVGSVKVRLETTGASLSHILCHFESSLVRIYFNEEASCNTCQLIKHYFSLDKRVLPLVIFLKAWARVRLYISAVYSTMYSFHHVLHHVLIPPCTHSTMYSATSTASPPTQGASAPLKQRVHEA